MAKIVLISDCHHYTILKGNRQVVLVVVTVVQKRAQIVLILLLSMSKEHSKLSHVLVQRLESLTKGALQVVHFHFPLKGRNYNQNDSPRLHSTCSSERDAKRPSSKKDFNAFIPSSVMGLSI